MRSTELTKPITTESLLKEFESRFNQTMALNKLTKEDLEDYANKIRTKIHEITQNTHFGKELTDDGYQKSQMMLDIVNQAIKERQQTNEILPAVGAALGTAARVGGAALAKGAQAAGKSLGSATKAAGTAFGHAAGQTAADKLIAPIQQKLSRGGNLDPDEKKIASKLMSSEDELKEVPGAGILKRMGRAVGSKAAGALGMKATQAGLQGKIQADKKAKQLYTNLRRYAGQTGADPNSLTVAELTSFLQKQGMKIDQLPKGPPGKVLNKQQTDDILMKSVQDTFKFQQEPTQTQAQPKANTEFMKQFQQLAQDPEMKKKLISVLQGQPITASAESVSEGVEEQSELILAAKDMMDKVTGYLEDLATMKTEGMLELADRIRDEMGADKADAFMQKIQPAIEQAEATLTTTRQELDNGVRILTGEETASEPMGADDTMNMDTDLDSLDSEGGEETDEFGASDAEAGGTEPEGREQRESREVFEQSNRILGKLAGK